MATFSSEIFKQKLVKKSLLVELDENDDILGSIKQAMKDHSIKEASIELMEGTIKTGKMSVMLGSQYKTIPLDNAQVINGSGHFKLSFDSLFGSLRVLAKTPKPENGKLEKGTGTSSLRIKLGFYKEEK